MRARALAALLLVLGATVMAPAQEQDQPHPLELQQAALAALQRGEYDEGERLLRRQIEMQPDNFVAHYNLACALALQGETEPAVESLKSAIKHGFVDIHQLQNDPDLASVQDDATVRAIIENWDRILEARIEANFESAKQQYSNGYTYEKDEALRLAYVSAFDEVSFADAREEMSLIASWTFEHVLTDLARPAQGDASQTDPWVIVILPTREDFKAWQERLFGPQATLATSEVGGRYDHDSKRLIARDLGATLRHEFFHVLHWRDMMRLRQRHAIWIQEGLGCLVEDFDRQPDGTLRLTPSWRTNMAQRLASAGRLTDIEDLARMSHTQFLRSSKLARYAESRTFFLYLAATGKLAEWYKTYTEHYGEDPTGVLATQKLFGEDMDAFQRQYEAWVKALPRVADMHEPGPAMLGIDIDPAGGEGLRVTSLVRRRDSGLRLGDIITAIDGRPTRDLNEMYRVLGDYRPGQTVTVRYRRHRVHGIAEVTLVAR
ncbi:MAG: TPR end-of-group domain-containing protein [Phycisphaerales bacterium JB039]